MGLRGSKKRLSEIIHFYMMSFALLKIERQALYLLAIAFSALAGLELVGFWLFAILFKSIHSSISNQSAAVNEFIIGDFNLSSIQVLSMATIALIGRTWISVLLNRSLYLFFTRKLIVISADNYAGFLGSDVSLQNKIGHQRAYSLLSFGTNSLIFGTVLGFFGLISDLLFAIFILVSMIIFIDLSALLVIMLLVVAGAVLILQNRRNMSNVGYSSSMSMERIGLIARESWGLRREIRLMSNESYFLDRFIAIRRESANSLYQLTFFGVKLRAKMEMLGLLCILGSTALFIASDNSENSFVSLGLIAIAVTRLTPILLRVQNTLINVFANMDYSMNLVQNMLDIESAKNRDLKVTKSILKKKKEIELKKKVRGKRLVELRDVSFSHDSLKLVVSGVNLDVLRGEVTLITGRSGSGKSTLLDILAGLLMPSNGEIVSQDDLRCAFVPQEISLFEGTILDNLLLGRETRHEDMVRIEKLFQKNGLLSFVSDLKEGSRTIIGEKGRGLSGGQRQLLGLARATLFPIDLLILDEPTNSLDKKSLKKLENLILYLSRRGTSCVIATHDKLLDTLASRVVKMSRGKIIGIQSNESPISNARIRN